MVEARIEWIKYENGGRKVIPPEGEKIYPMIMLENEGLIPWSFWLKNKTFLGNFTTLAEMDFLLENAPHDRLISGKEFSLYEGKKKIALGKIV